jgi:FKBP-type peptidyl-prolyl cis-trans isomerase 2
MMGMEEGERRTIEVKPEEGYGSPEGIFRGYKT